MKQVNNFIGGRRQAAASGRYLDSFNPATGQVSAQIADSDGRDIDAAAAAARAAFPAWAQTPVAERARLLQRVADLIQANGEELARLESEDQGKPRALAAAVDIPRAQENFRFYAGAVLHHTEQASAMDGKAINYVHRRPVGVAGLISPWNLPLYLLTWKIAPALAVGNTAICKPSELTSQTASRLCDLMGEAGIPPGVCNMVFGYGHKAGSAMVLHKDVPLISFTGGTETARSIIKDSSVHFKKLSLELGGKNPTIVFDDADLTRCIPETVRAGFANQGEICLCGSRIFVQRGIYAEFLNRYAAGVKALKVGDPADPRTNLGALVSAQHREKVLYYVALAQEEGGQIVTGGRIPDLPAPFCNGYFLEPTVVTGLSPQCRVLQEEIFGPMVTISPFDEEEEVVAYANDIRYGLSANIWTRDLGRAHRVAQQVEAGVVWVNCWLLRDLRTPFGGMKASGIGREGGIHAIDFYTETQNICIKY